MRVIICAAGDGSRWNNYLGTRKHLASIDGERLLDRTVGQLMACGITDIRITNHPSHPYTIPGVTCYPSYTKEATTARKLTWPHWCETTEHDGRTLLMLGDVYYTDATIATMTTPIEGWHQYGRLAPSRATGKPGAEMFGWQFHTAQHQEFIAAIEAVDAARAAGVQTHVDWSLYSYMTGHDISTPPDAIRDWGRHVEIPDDGTDDFDFPDDYERFLSVYLHRGGRIANAADFREPWFEARTREMNLHPKLHRKLWEFCVIAQAYRDRIGGGGQALGFGVGKEPLPAWLAAQGAQVLATDRPDPGRWLERQHARGHEELRHEGICTDAAFNTRVAYQPLDMNAIPDALHGEYDFTWSAGSFEHLGGIKAGLAFFCEQMKCLKQGGIAVHTTEYNFRSNTGTLDTPDICAFRQGDLLDLTHRLRAQGDRLWPLVLTRSGEAADLFIDRHPYTAETHLNMELGGHAFTSIVLIAARGI